jgi:hypothetical protein
MKNVAILKIMKRIDRSALPRVQGPKLTNDTLHHKLYFKHFSPTYTA